VNAHNDVRRAHGISTLAPAPTRARHKSRNSGHQPRDIARPTRALMHIHVRPGAVGRHMQKESTRTDQTRAHNDAGTCPILTGQGIHLFGFWVFIQLQRTVGGHVKKKLTKTNQTRARNAYGTCPILTGQGIQNDPTDTTLLATGCLTAMVCGRARGKARAAVWHASAHGRSTRKAEQPL
jgi:hypothetical protein